MGLSVLPQWKVVDVQSAATRLCGLLWCRNQRLLSGELGWMRFAGLIQCL